MAEGKAREDQSSEPKNNKLAGKKKGGKKSSALGRPSSRAAKKGKNSRK